MSNTKLAKVPKKWHDERKKLAKQLGISTPKAIMLVDGVFAKVIKKKGKRGNKFEITI